MIVHAEPITLSGLVVAEILQGLIRDIARIERYLLMWDLLEPRGFVTYQEAANISRLARAKGITLTTVDTIIAAIALEHRAAVFTLDRDFGRIAQVTNLQLHTLS